MDTFNEGSSIIATFSFKDPDGEAVQASALECVVTDKDSGTEVSRQTASPSSETYALKLSDAASAIITATNNAEIRILTWFFTYSATINGVPTTCKGNDETCFRIKNMIAAPTA